MLKSIFNKNSFLKIITTLFCTGGLTFHIFQLFNEYMRGKTVVSINVNRIFNDSLPAITICYPFSISFEKLSKFDLKYSTEYENYLDILKFERDNSTLRRIYNNVTKTAINAINSGTLKLSDIMQNAIIKYSDFNDNLSVTVILDDPMHDEYLDERQKESIKLIGKPIESTNLMIKDNGDLNSGRCFTYFTRLQKQWRNFKYPFSLIFIRLNYNMKLIPRSIYNHALIAIHSPNRLPDFYDDEFETLTLGKRYLITYSQIRTELLGSDYDTNCYEYDLDYKHANFNMRSDCFAWCYQNEVNRVCNTETFVPSTCLFRDVALVQAYNKTIETCLTNDKQKIFKIKLFCFDSCRKDCVITSYDFLARSSLQDKKYPDRIDIFIEHNNMPDILIKSIPEITFISFVCNFGGLLGMWLGLSILVTFNEIFKAFVLLFSKRTIFNKINFNPTMIHLSNPNIISKVNVCLHDNNQANKAEEPIFIKYKEVNQ